MCLINLAWQQHKHFRLIMVANRDEFYDRPAARAGWWEDHPNVLAGRDLKAGGTWMGANRQGYFAAVTNFREAKRTLEQEHSRGELVGRYLTEAPPPGSYLLEIEQKSAFYQGMNFLAGNAEELWYYSNRGGAPCKLESGIYGLSNHLLDTSWAKVVRSKVAFTRLIRDTAFPDPALLMDVLTSTEGVPDEQLPNTGIPIELERLLGPMFIRLHHYGTRVTTVLMMDYDNNLIFAERSYEPKGEMLVYSFATEMS
ncbi:MAG: NRDE family protein [Bacteroidetes bacterium]|nr:MAG: NRDE family protein [Bacteroidota bacterium]